MKVKVKFTAVIIMLALVCALVFTACGEGGGDSGTTTTSPVNDTGGGADNPGSDQPPPEDLKMLPNIPDDADYNGY